MTVARGLVVEVLARQRLRKRRLLNEVGIELGDHESFGVVQKVALERQSLELGHREGNLSEPVPLVLVLADPGEDLDALQHVDNVVDASTFHFCVVNKRQSAPKVIVRQEKERERTHLVLRPCCRGRRRSAHWDQSRPGSGT